MTNTTTKTSEVRELLVQDLTNLTLHTDLGETRKALLHALAPFHVFTPTPRQGFSARALLVEDFMKAVPLVGSKMPEASVRSLLKPFIFSLLKKPLSNPEQLVGPKPSRRRQVAKLRRAAKRLRLKNTVPAPNAPAPAKPAFAEAQELVARVKALEAELAELRAVRTRFVVTGTPANMDPWFAPPSTIEAWTLQQIGKNAPRLHLLVWANTQEEAEQRAKKAHPGLLVSVVVPEAGSNPWVFQGVARIGGAK